MIGYNLDAITASTSGIPSFAAVYYSFPKAQPSRLSNNYRKHKSYYELLDGGGGLGASESGWEPKQRAHGSPTGATMVPDWQSLVVGLRACGALRCLSSCFTPPAHVPGHQPAASCAEEWGWCRLCAIACWNLAHVLHASNSQSSTLTPLLQFRWPLRFLGLSSILTPHYLYNMSPPSDRSAAGSPSPTSDPEVDHEVEFTASAIATLKMMAHRAHAARVPYDDDGSEQHRAFRRAISNVLSTELALSTFAQIVDGLPMADTAYNRRMHGLDPDHPVDKHEELCPGVMERTREIRDQFDPSILLFNPAVHNLHPPPTCYGTPRN